MKILKEMASKVSLPEHEISLVRIKGVCGYAVIQIFCVDYS